MTAVLSVCDLFFSYGERRVLNGVSTAFSGGEFYGVIGPNGSGKTTLFQLLSGYRMQEKGEILLFERPIRKYRAWERAKLLAQLPQETGPIPFTVRELVSLGRVSHRLFGAWHPQDKAAVEEAIREMELSELANRSCGCLSGGERHRALIASALAQSARVLLLDEPTASLDLGHAMKLMRHLKHLAHDHGLAVVVISHDVELLSRTADRLLLMKEGNILASGSAESVLTPENLRCAYGIDAEIVRGNRGELLLSY